MAETQVTADGMVLAHFIMSDDVERARRFYTEASAVRQSGRANRLTLR